MFGRFFDNTAPAAWQIVLIEYSLFFLVFGVFYAVLYGPFRAFWNPRKYHSRYPTTSLVSKEMMRSIVGVLVCCGYSIWIAHLNGVGKLPYQQSIEYAENDGPTFLKVVVVLVGLTFWSDFHFYCVHRLLHEIGPLYKHVHKIHHESYNPDPWSGLSFHPLESVIYFSNVLIVLALPVPYWASFYHQIALLLTPANGHQGHELAPAGCLGSHHHYIHHAKFNYNYGSPFPLWDIIMGTEYPAGGDEKSARAKAAREQAALAGK